MACNVEMFMIVGRKYLEEYFNSSFMQFENCCGVCWCCFKRKSISDEFEKNILKHLIHQSKVETIGRFASSCKMGGKQFAKTS